MYVLPENPQTLFSEKLQELAASGLSLSGGVEADEVAAAAAAATMERTPVVVAVHDCDPGADPDALEVNLQEYNRILFW